MWISRLLSAVLVTAAAASTTATSASAMPPTVSMVAPGYPTANYTAQGALGSSCTAGFVVRNPNDTPILLMAGHCDEGGQVAIPYRETDDWQPVGSFIANMYTPPFSLTLPDIGAVPLKSTSVPVSSDLLGRTPITGAARPTVGQRLCKVGSYSATTCGNVIKVTSSKVFFTAFNRQGDSAGPVYFENGDGTVTAVGLDSGMPSLDCGIDIVGNRDCGGITVAELIVPWMQKWQLRF